MSLKQSILHILEQNREINISGQDLARQFSVSRAAVWKAINELKKEGYFIQAVPNKGYRIAEGTDLLSAEGIQPHVKQGYASNTIMVYKTINSTNEEAKKQLAAGASNGTILVAEEQTSGRGRLGRNFFSPPGTGIYMSVLLRPQMNVSDAVLITTAAAVAVCRAIEKLTTLKPQIKWVNDIFLQGRKVCGILTEAVTDFESGTVESVIVGIGVNFKTPSELFPHELQETAGSLFSPAALSSITRNQLTAEIINHLLDIYQVLHHRDFLQEYKARSMILGQKVSIYQNKQWQTVTALDFDEDGGLIVQTAEGNREILRSGEISLRSLANSL